MTDTLLAADEEDLPGRSRRGRILDDEDIAVLYDRPSFTDEERETFFTLSQAEQSHLETMEEGHVQLYFLLQLGYFHAKHRFFPFTFAAVATDVDYLRQRYLADVQDLALTRLNPRTIGIQRDTICALTGYRPTTAVERDLIAERARQVARISSKPVYVFQEVLDYLTDQRIIGPKYTVMQDLIRQALTAEHRRITQILEATILDIEAAALDALLTETAGRVPLTWLRPDPKATTHTAMRDEIQRGATLRPLYDQAQQVIPLLEISREAVAYYAWLASSYYTVVRLQRLSPWTRRLYLLCFVQHRYQRFNDHLIGCFLQVVKEYSDEATGVAQELVAAQRLALTRDLPKAGRALKLLATPPYPPETTIATLQTAAYQHLSAARLNQLADYLIDKSHIDEAGFYWQHISALVHRVKTRLRPVFGALALSALRPNAPLLEAVQFLQAAFAAGRTLSKIATEEFPVRAVPVRQKRHVYTTDAEGYPDLLRDRYEFLIYRQVRKAIESGDLFCRDSVQYRSFEDDLISAEAWQDKETILANLGVPLLLQPIQEQLAALETELEAQIVTVNQRITSGENTHVTVRRGRKRTTWLVRYPRPRDPVNHAFFDQLPHVNMASVLQWANERCSFMAAFTHGSGRYQKQPPDAHLIRACLVAWGTNMGLGRMGSISDIPYHTLALASENYLRLETLQAANDRVCNAIAAMPLFQQYDLGGHVHSSSDGQKFESQRPTITARHSPKYFGLKKGMVDYSLVASHLPIGARVIGAHEHESHYVFDLLKNNTTDIRPTMHSTDTHGTNQVNFALLHLFGYMFAPRFKNLPKKVRTSLSGFRLPREYGELLLAPMHKLNTALIEAEWDNLLRIFASLALKTTSQHIIVRKLNAYARKNTTRQALWEYDRIISSRYLLRYVDSPTLRQNVQRALNRGEQYHQLRRAVSYANFGKLRFTTEEDQQIWSECSRLIANCIICYNMHLIAEFIAQKEAAGDQQSVSVLREVSPVAWQHINFYGRYEFATLLEAIDVEAIVAGLLHHQFKSVTAAA